MRYLFVSSLIDYLEVAEDGRYLFDNVPILLGQNRFKIILYGPQGEQQVIEEQFTGHQLEQEAGQWTPSFSFSQPKKRADPQNGLNLNAKLNYGFNDTLQGTLVWNQTQKQQYFNTALTGVWQNTVFNISAAMESDNHNFAYLADLQSTLWHHNWNFGYRKMAGIQSQTSDVINFSVLGHQSMFSEQDNYSLAFNYSDSPESTAFAMTGQYSANFKQLNLNNRFEAQQNQQGSITTTTATGTSSISGRMGQHQLRLESRYRLWPETEIETVSASYGHRFKSAYLKLRGNLRQNEGNSDISAQLSWRFNHFRLGARLLIDEQKNINAGLTFSMSLGVLPSSLYSRLFSRLHYSRDSLKRTATIKAMAFMDDNHNGLFDRNEAPVAGVSFKGNDKWTGAKTNAQGVVYLPQAKTASAQYLEFDSDSLDDPFLAVDESRFNIKTHAGGLNELYFPIYQTTEIEGEIILKKTTEGQAKAQAAVPLLLLDLQGRTVKRVLSEYDGFFIFDGVKPGQYRIVVESKYLQRKGFSFQQTVAVDASDINQDSDSIEVGSLLIVVDNR
ncbi:MAG: hypothetical protein ACI8WB_001009 [Phenylobacterium sp.]